MRYTLRFLGNLLRICLLPLWLLARRMSRPRSRWVEVRLHPHPVEIDGTLSFVQRLLQRQKPGAAGRLRSIAELRRLFELVATDPDRDGVLLYVPQLSCGFATCQSLRGTVLALRARGKRVVAFMPLGGGNRELLVALAADRVLTTPPATISLLGAFSQSVYLKPLLDRAGLEAEVLARGEYKTAAEAVLREAMSEPQREQLSALLNVVQRELEQAVAGRPGFDAARARALFERGLWGASAALAEGVIDACCYEDELPEQLGIQSDPALRPLRHTRYAAYRRARLWQRVSPKPQIGVVRVHGAITHGDTPLPGSRTATLSALTAALRRAGRNKRIRAVLLDVDSPGGSALASDLVHREIVRLREKKPVVAYLGDVAASGGYYLAAPCNRIHAQPATITGSIGVVSVRLLGGALAERIGIRPQTVRTAPHADMLSPFRPLDEAERAMLWSETESMYQTFVRVVSEGRRRSPEEVENVARGRVWAGVDALQHGLVDQLGGLDLALAALCDSAPELRGGTADAYELTLVAAGRGEQPAPEPAEATALSAWLGRFGLSEFGEVLRLAGKDERVLYYGAIPDLW